MSRESVIEKYLVARVKEAGGKIRKVQWIGYRNAPDRLVLFKGHHPLVEIKATGKDATDAQSREHARLTKAGFRVWVINCKEDVDRLIEQCTSKKK